MQPETAIVQRDKGKGQIVKFGSKLCVMKSVANRKYYTKVPLTTSTQGDRKYRYFQSRDEYNNYLKRKSGVKVQAPPDYEKSILCSFMGQLCMIKSQMGFAGMPDRVEKPGSRGGKYWIDKQGKVQYGEKPKGRVKKIEEQPQPKPQANIFGGTDKPEATKKKPDAQQSQKAREMQWLMEKIKSGKLPKGAEKLVNPKKTSPKKQAANEEKWETGLFSEGKKQQGLFEEKKQIFSPATPKEEKNKKEPWEMTADEFYDRFNPDNVKEPDLEYVERDFYQVKIGDYHLRVITPFDINKKERYFVIDDQKDEEKQFKSYKESLDYIRGELKKPQDQPPAPPDGKGEEKPAAAPESGKGKEAWEMTKEEWDDVVNKPINEAIKGSKGLDTSKVDKVKEQLEKRFPNISLDNRRYEVQLARAIMQKKEIPKEIISKYPKARWEMFIPDIPEVVDSPLVPGKHLWEMTFSEIEKQLSNVRSSDKFTHRMRIRRALSEGKPVPRSVLQDYPELSKENEKNPYEESNKAYLEFKNKPTMKNEDVRKEYLKTDLLRELNDADIPPVAENELWSRFGLQEKKPSKLVDWQKEAIDEAEKAIRKKLGKKYPELSKLAKKTTSQNAMKL